MCQVQLLLQVLRGEELVVDDRIGHVGRILCQGLYAPLAEDISLHLPGGVLQVVGGELDEQAQRMLARGRGRRVCGRVDDAVHVRLPGGMTVFSVVPGSLQVINGRADAKGPDVLGPQGFAGVCLEIGQLAQGQVHLEHYPLGSNATQSVPELLVQMLGLHQPQQGSLGVCIRDHYPGVYHLSADQLDTSGPGVTDDDPGNLSLRTYGGPVALGTSGEGLGDRPHTPGHGTQGDAAFGPVVEHHVNAAGSIRPPGQAHRPTGSDACLHLLRLEPGVQEVLHRAEHHLVEEVDIGRVVEFCGHLGKAEGRP